jgi:predicted PurR-regulated permease PerM
MGTKNKLESFITQSFGAFGKYLLGKSISCLIMVVVAGVVLKILGIKGAFWIGLLLGLGNLVPMVGVWIATAISAVIVLIQTVPDRPLVVLYLIGIAIVLQVLDEFIITPLVVGKTIDLKPLVIIGAVYLGGMLFGIPGMIFAVPAAAIIKIAYEIFFKRKDKDTTEQEMFEEDHGGEV